MPMMVHYFFGAAQPGVTTTIYLTSTTSFIYILKKKTPKITSTTLAIKFMANVDENFITKINKLALKTISSYNLFNGLLQSRSRKIVKSHAIQLCLRCAAQLHRFFCYVLPLSLADNKNLAIVSSPEPKKVLTSYAQNTTLLDYETIIEKNASSNCQTIKSYVILDLALKLHHCHSLSENPKRFYKTEIVLFALPGLKNSVTINHFYSMTIVRHFLHEASASSIMGIL
uniref:Uncharacterized protein n=1 Tax=Glossina pallidipes TaxID=7398 RepID=A0A1B0A7C5_GLOPL